jgi:hypothetical protein
MSTVMIRTQCPGKIPSHGTYEDGMKTEQCTGDLYATVRLGGGVDGGVEMECTLVV